MKRTRNLLPLALGLFAASAFGVTITNNTALSPGDTTYEGADLIVSDCTLTVNGEHSFAWLLLTNGAVRTHSSAPGGETNNRVLLIITGDATIATNCSVDVTGRGYTSAGGAGAGCSNVSESGGGGGPWRHRRCVAKGLPRWRRL